LIFIQDITYLNIMIFLSLSGWIVAVLYLFKETKKVYQFLKKTK